MTKNLLESSTRKEILRILVEEGRTGLVKIAKTLGISHVAVIKHIKSLTKSGVIKIQANVNLKNSVCTKYYTKFCKKFRGLA